MTRVKLAVESEESGGGRFGLISIEKYVEFKDESYVNTAFAEPRSQTEAPPVRDREDTLKGLRMKYALKSIGLMTKHGKSGTVMFDEVVPPKCKDTFPPEETTDAKTLTSTGSTLSSASVVSKLPIN
jgi:hypothetical protein